MLRLLLLALFVVIPILELAIIIEVGRHLGTIGTLVLVLGTGVAGSWIAQTQGIAVLNRARWELDAGRLPADELLHGLFVLVGGVLLLLPGLLTDAIGLLLLLPATRRAAVAWLKEWLTRQLQSGTFRIYFRR